MQMRDYQRSASGFIHGFRYNVRFLYHWLTAKSGIAPLPQIHLQDSPDSIANVILDRINHTAGMWQQYGFLGDCICLKENTSILYPEIPLDFAEKALLGEQHSGLLISLEYGHISESTNPFSINRYPTHEVENADKSVFLHPVIRWFHQGNTEAEFHLGEDLYAKWDHEEKHRLPLLNFLSSILQKKSHPVSPKNQRQAKSV